MSKVIEINADETAATVSEPEILDIATTAFSTKRKLTGVYGLIQTAGLVVAGMGLEAYMRTGSVKPKILGGV